MSGRPSAESGHTTEPEAKQAKMASSSGEAAEPGGNAGTAQAAPLLRAAAALEPALPRRAAGIPLPALPPARTIQPPVSPELLRRVLDGLKKL
jgi:hypothetical protein